MTKAQDRQDLALFRAVARRVSAGVRQVLGRKIRSARVAYTAETGTHGWICDVAQVDDSLWMELEYDHYLGLETSRFFSVWLGSEDRQRIDDLAANSALAVRPRRSYAHRTGSWVLKSPGGWLGTWFIDDWAKEDYYWFGRFSRTGHAGHGIDRIVRGLVADLRTLGRSLPEHQAKSPREQKRKPATKFVQSDKATMALVERRAGQRGFRQHVLVHFDERCVITGCDVKGALEAAHIVPWAHERKQDPGAALLLRADLHVLFDRGLINIAKSGGKAVVVIDDSLEGTEPYGLLPDDPLAGASYLRPSHWRALRDRQRLGKQSGPGA
ncbi:MAG: HNH endonuclease [Deltaproteobacteria bacterium]|jgi:hypothetical protein